MVRTADMAIKTGGKNSKARPSGSSARNRSPSNSSTDRAYSSYNTVCQRETPTWQKPITSFFQNVEKTRNDTLEEEPIRESIENPQNKIPDITMEDVPVSNGNDVVEQITTNGAADTEMEEGFENIVTKIRRRDEEHDMVPKKKRKLDINTYAGLELLEKQ